MPLGSNFYFILMCERLCILFKYELLFEFNDRNLILKEMDVQLVKKERTYELIINFLILYENLITYKLKVNFKKKLSITD